MEITASRIVALLIAIGYVVWDIVSRHGVHVSAFMIAFIMLFPLSFIWFSDLLGDKVAGRVTRRTPAGFVAFGGWLLLLTPLVIYAIFSWYGVPLQEYRWPWQF